MAGEPLRAPLLGFFSVIPKSRLSHPVSRLSHSVVHASITLAPRRPPLDFRVNQRKFYMGLNQPIPMTVSSYFRHILSSEFYSPAHHGTRDIHNHATACLFIVQFYAKLLSHCDILAHIGQQTPSIPLESLHGVSLWNLLPHSEQTPPDELLPGESSVR